MIVPTNKNTTTEKDKTGHKVKDYTAKQKEQIIAKGNPKIDNNIIKGYN